MRRLSGGRGGYALRKNGKCPSGYKQAVRCVEKVADASKKRVRQYRQVYRGTADRTKSGMRKNQLTKNRKGRIVSKKKSEAAKAQWKKQMQDPEFKRKWNFMKAKDSGRSSGPTTNEKREFRLRGQEDKDNLEASIAAAAALSGGAKDCEVGRRMIVCVRKSNKKKPCKDGKRRVDGGRCSPGRKTPCKKDSQVRRKNSSGKYVCADKKKRKKTPCKDNKRRIQGKGPCVPGRKTPCNKDGQIRRKVSKGKNKGKYVCGDPKKRKSSKKKSAAKKKSAKKKSKKKKSKKKTSAKRRVSTRSQARRTRSGKRLIDV